MNQLHHQPTSEQRFAIALPCAPEDFASFISSLLGKPQTITNSVDGAFEVRKDDIENSYHLVVQRIEQQNDAHLLQFTVRLIFDDNSSVLLNSLEDFLTYSEVRPIYPTQAHLSWSFMVKFPDRNHPEKQDIDLSFLTSSHGGFFVGENAKIPFFRQAGGHIAFRIRHTARTWGADIESLLSGHAEHLLHPESSIRKFVRTHSEIISLILGVFFFLSTIAACFFTASQLAVDQLKLVSNLMDSTPDLDIKINRLLEMTAEGFWGKFFFSVLIFMVISLFSSAFLAIWAESSADASPPSYILLTKKADQIKKKNDSRYRFKWFSFLSSLTIAITTGICSNIIFTKYWAN